MLQLYDKIEEITNAEQTCVKLELGQCSQTVKEVCKQAHTDTRMHTHTHTHTNCDSHTV